MKYEDPENIQEIIKDIFQLKTVKEIIDLLKTIYPDFVIAFLNNYSKDYPHFENNWKGMCLTLNVKPAQIIIVDDYEDNSNYLLLKTFAELLTQSGFIIRKYTEFNPCSVCNLAIPSPIIYNKLKESKIKVPEVWDTKCSSCKSD